MFKIFVPIQFLFLMLTIDSFALKVEKVTAEKCPMGEHWVRAHEQRAYNRSDGTSVSGSYHSAHCQKNPPAYAVWNDRIKNKAPTKWEFKSEKSKDWTDEERDRILDALSELPTELLRDSITGIFRFYESSQTRTNPAAAFLESLAMYDPAFTKTANLTRILGHEFSHELYRQMPTNERIDYAKAGEWQAAFILEGLKEPHFFSTRDGFVEEDGKDSITEDFANNIEYFLFNPEVLKRKSPRVYDWILKHYGDKFKVRSQK